ncbi:polyprotein [Anopheles sinensis]|uniref:Polyprotein n=1 Tax=Anopheles sinensis TaxID=74873 RepID=A0A084VKU8_ANOSI|nr:polyprotein [Anopheles sinensis]
MASFEKHVSNAPVAHSYARPFEASPIPEFYLLLTCPKTPTDFLRTTYVSGRKWLPPWLPRPRLERVGRGWLHPPTEGSLQACSGSCRDGRRSCHCYGQASRAEYAGHESPENRRIERRPHWRRLA